MSNIKMVELHSGARYSILQRLKQYNFYNPIISIPLLFAHRNNTIECLFEYEDGSRDNFRFNNDYEYSIEDQTYDFLIGWILEDQQPRPYTGYEDFTDIIAVL